MAESRDTVILDALLEAAHDAIVVADAQGIILRANPSASALFGHAPGTLVGRTVDDLIPGGITRLSGGAAEMPQAWGRRAAPHPAREAEGRRADGTTVPLSVSLARAEAAGAPVHVAVFHDLSTRRAMEEAAERSQKMDAIGRMTGGIAHDFNNLLTVVIGNLQLLEKAELSDRHRAMLADALSAAELGADLTSRLTVFARNSDLRPRTVDLTDEIEQCLSLLRHTIGSHCTVATAAEPGLWPVSVDSAKLQTAILNLAMNSQDAMAQGGTLTIEAQNVDIDDSYIAQELGVSAGRYVRLSVSDTGQGMTPEQRDRALEPFFTTKPPGQGTGLGLPMVYGFVKQSGGHLSIYSEPGEGTVVSLYFPALEPGALSGEADAPALAAPLMPPGDRTILIVEDDEKLRRLTRTRLEALGYRCLVAATADAAWSILEGRDDIALVFADMVTPGTLSGYDLARRIAARRPGIAVLLTSGFSESVLRNRRIGNEFHMLRKPYRQSDLEREVQALLAGRAGTGSPGSVNM